MANGDWMTDVDRLADAVNGLQKCFDCTICLELMTMPMKTRCGHSFCKLCIEKILRRKNAHCPLCNKSLKKRSISKDDHLEACIWKFMKLVTAIQDDSHIDILFHSKLPCDTKESCSNSNGSQSNNSNRRGLSKKQSAHQSNQNISKTARSSTANRGTIIGHNNPPCDSAISNEEPVIILPRISDVHPLLADENGDAVDEMDYKPRTWIHAFPDELSVMEDEISLDQNKIVSDNSIFDRNDSCTRVEIRDDTHCNKRKRQENYKTEEQDTATSGLKYTMSHARIRANLAKEHKESTSTRKSDVQKKTESQNNSSSVTTYDQTSPIEVSSDDHSALHSASTSICDNKQSSTNMTWSRVIEVGKEMRTKKKVKKLNVSTERNKTFPRIVEDVVLMSSNKYDLSKSTTKHNTSDKDTNNLSNLSLESQNREQNVDKSSILSITDTALLLSDRKAENWKKSSVENATNNSSSQVNYDTATYITLGEGKKVNIQNLNNHQMKDIIGFRDGNVQSLNRTNVRDNSHHLEENLKIMTKPRYIRTSPLHSKRLNVLTPEKLNENARKHDAIRNIERTPVNDFASSSRVLAENRTPSPRVNNNSTQKISGNTQLLSSTPNKGILSRRRNQAAKRDISPSLSQLSLANRLSANKDTRKSVSDSKNVDSPVSQNALSLDRLIAVKRDLNLQMVGENRPMQTGQNSTASGTSSKRTVPIADNDGGVSGIVRQDDRHVVEATVSRKSTNIKNKTDSREKRYDRSVKFMQLGTLIRRRDVKYIYASTTKREQSMPAKVQIMPVYNMQQSISRSEIKQTVADYDVISPNPLNNAEDSINVMENIHLNNSVANPVAISTDVELSVAFPTCNIPVSSTPKRNTDCCLDREQMIVNVCSSTTTNQQLDRSAQDVEGSVRSYLETSCTDRNVIEKKIMHLEKTNLFKLLSPDKDSQLKFLSIDSPVTERKKFKLTNVIQRQWELAKSTIEENNVSVSKMRKTPLSSESSEFVPQFSSSRKRKRCDKEPFVDHSDHITSNSSDDSDDSRRTIKFNVYKKILSKSSNSLAVNANKKQYLESPHVQDAEIICIKSETEKRDAHRRKFKRIISISSSDTDTETESSKRITRNRERNRIKDELDESTQITNTPKKKYLRKQESNEDRCIRNKVDKWTNEYNMQKKLIKENRNTQDSNRSIKCSSEKDMTTQRSSPSINTPKSEKRKDIRSGQKCSPVTESDLFDSNSVFNSNLEHIVAHQLIKAKRSKPSQNSADPFVDDIINKVLQINRSENNADASGSMVPITLNDRTSQKGKDNKEYNLLQDNFDEIIANVELPQSEDIISCIEQSDRNHNRMLTEQNASDCNHPAVTNESRDVTQDISIMPVLSTNDIFENCYSVKNVKKSRFDVPTNTISKNSDKENIALHSQENYVEDRRDKKAVMAKCLVGTDEIFYGTITSKNDTSSEKERSFDRRVDSNEKYQTDARINISTRSTGGSLYTDGEIQAETAIGNEPSLKNTSPRQNSYMDITQQQLELEMFEEDLFGLAARNQAQTTKMTFKNDSSREEQRTPKRKKQSARNKDTVSEEHSAEEDDVVENTPETKMRNRRKNSRTIDSDTKINIATPCLSPISSTKPSNNPSSSKRSTPRTGASTPMSGVKMYPLYQSTPKLSSTSTTGFNVFTIDEKSKRIVSDGISQARQIERKARENVQQQLRQQQSYRQTLCFVCSGLTAVQIGNVKELAQKLHVNYLNKFDYSVTHVIVDTTGEQNLAKRTLKCLQGIAHRKWIVSYKWIEDCIKQQKLLDEIPYEATTCSDGAGPRNSRLRDKGLFEGFTFLCIGPYDDVSLDQYQDLLLATGAIVVDTLEALAEKKNLKGILIEGNMHDEKIEYWYRYARAAPITTDWIVECIGQYKLISLFPFIQNLSTQDLYAINYPRELVEEDEYSDTSI